MNQPLSGDSTVSTELATKRKQHALNQNLTGRTCQGQRLYSRMCLVWHCHPFTERKGLVTLNTLLFQRYIHVIIELKLPETSMELNSQVQQQKPFLSFGQLGVIVHVASKRWPLFLWL